MSMDKRAEKTEISPRDALMLARMLMGEPEPSRVVRLVGSLSPRAMSLGEDLQIVLLGGQDPKLERQVSEANARCAALIKWGDQTKKKE
jgi:hypothetical protein